MCGLQKFSLDFARQKSSIPKFQVHNNALKTVYCDATFSQALINRKIWGHIFESGIGAYLTSQAFAKRFDVFYWRNRDDEVDFILRKRGVVVAIEVKSNAEKKTKGLSAFRELFQPRTSFIVGDGGIPTKEFLTMDVNNLFS